MTKLLNEAIQRLKRLPESMQDSAARAVIMLVEEDAEPGDDELIRDGLEAFARGDYVNLDDWRHEMGLGDRRHARPRETRTRFSLSCRRDMSAAGRDTGAP